MAGTWLGVHLNHSPEEGAEGRQDEEMGWLLCNQAEGHFLEKVRATDDWQGITHLRVRLRQAAEQGTNQAAIPGSPRGDERGQLVGVAHKAEGAGLQDGAQGCGQRDLPRLIQDADIKDAALEQSMPHAQACGGHLQVSAGIGGGRGGGWGGGGGGA